jgi:hypothetical protein
VRFGPQEGTQHTAVVLPTMSQAIALQPFLLCGARKAAYVEQQDPLLPRLAVEAGAKHAHEALHSR